MNHLRTQITDNTTAFWLTACRATTCYKQVQQNKLQVRHVDVIILQRDDCRIVLAIFTMTRTVSRLNDCNENRSSFHPIADSTTRPNFAPRKQWHLSWNSVETNALISYTWKVNVTMLYRRSTNLCNICILNFRSEQSIDGKSLCLSQRTKNRR